MHPWKQLLLGAIPSGLPTALGQNVIDLNGDGWTVSSSALNITVPGRVPSQAHLDLFAAGVIDDPYHGLNDFNLRWIANNNWTYTSKPIQGLYGPNTLFDGSYSRNSDFIGSLPEQPSLSIEIKDIQSGDILKSESLDNVAVVGQAVSGQMTVDADAPRLWWPTGMGSQPLYNLTVTIRSDGQDVATVTKRTAFRTIFLNQSNITEAQIAQGIAPGANWHFEVNGREFYAKGSNIIPPDAFWPRVTEAKMKRLFDAVVAGNQNMLRVWSSSIYLPDFMYDLADERGVLLWSEIQFSDALYPTDQPFLDNVAAEVVYNVRRVNHHPSLALWAGGNEIESLELPTAKKKAPEHYEFLVGDYEHLFISLILPLVYENTRSISYMPSSTNDGYLKVDLSAPVPMVERYDNGTDQEGYYYGDTDYYNYDSSVAFDFEGYPVGRFANEFGYHSMPSLQTWQQAVDEEDLHFNSSTIVLRNHHYPASGPDTHNYKNASMGMAEMTLAVERYYPIPNKDDSVANFSAWCHATQLFQADMYKSEIQFYRRGSGMPERQLGSLYWQLEDIWQAPTWAGIEYDGRWKVLHYTARDIYQPIIVSPFWNSSTGDLSVYVTSDLWETAHGNVTFKWTDLSGKAIPDNAGTPETKSFSVGALNTTCVYNTNISKITLPSVEDAVLIVQLTAEGHLPNKEHEAATTFTHRNQFTPAYPKDLALKDPQLQLSRDAESSTFTVEAKSAVSLYTWLDYPAGVVGYFEDNSFMLAPGEKRSLTFFVQKDETGGKWVDGVTVRSLWDQTTS